MDVKKCYKSCCVPLCTSTTKATPDKLFFSLPMDQKRRRAWLDACGCVNTPSKKSHLYMCEDHFDLQEDLSNFFEFLNCDMKPMFKAEILPRFFTCQEKKKNSSTDRSRIPLSHGRAASIDDQTNIDCAPTLDLGHNLSGVSVQKSEPAPKEAVTNKGRAASIDDQTNIDCATTQNLGHNSSGASVKTSEPAPNEAVTNKGPAASTGDQTNVDRTPTLNSAHNLSFKFVKRSVPALKEAPTIKVMQPPTESTKTEGTSRPSLKRKRDESCSIQSECQFLLYEMARKPSSCQKKEEPTVTVEMEHQEAQLVCNLLSDATGEPFSSENSVGERFSDTIVNNDPFSGSIFNEEPSNQSVSNSAPFDVTVKDGPFDGTVFNEVPLDNMIWIKGEPIDGEELLGETEIKEEPLDVTIAKNDSALCFFNEPDSLVDNGQRPFHTVDDVPTSRAFVDNFPTSSTKMGEDLLRIESVVSLSQYFQQNSGQVVGFGFQPLVVLNNGSSTEIAKKSGIQVASGKSTPASVANHFKFPNQAEKIFSHKRTYGSKTQNVPKESSTNKNVTIPEIQNVTNKCAVKNQNVEQIPSEPNSKLEAQCSKYILIAPKPTELSKQHTKCTPNTSKAQSSKNFETKTGCSKNSVPELESSQLEGETSRLESNLENEINLFPRKQRVKSISFPSPAHEELYTHICKYHLKSNKYKTMRLNVTVPKLLQVSEPPKNSIELFQCQWCPEMFETANKLEGHVSNLHPNCLGDVLRCKVCHFPLKPQLNKILEHIKNHKNYYNHFVGPWKMWQCIECESLSNRCDPDKSKLLVIFHLNNITLLRNHSLDKFKLVNTVHFHYKFDRSLPEFQHVQNLYGCLWCMSRFETETELGVHLEQHVDCGFRTCSKCNLRCDNVGELYDHVDKMHVVVKGCMDFSQKKTLKQHTNLKSVNQCSWYIDNLPDNYVKINQQSISQECPICKVGFSDPMLFYSHCVPYTPLLPILLQECPECGEKFESEFDATVHLKRAHLGKYNFCCRICMLPHNAFDELKNHVLKEHNLPVVYCVMCKTKVVSKHEAFTHLKICYLRNMRVQWIRQCNKHDYICPICGLICDDYEFLINHIRIDFSVLSSKHQCKFCLNYFYGKFNLACHLSDGKCEHCDQYFCDVKNLADHVVSVHSC